MELNLDFNLDDYELSPQKEQVSEEIELIELADTHALLPDPSMQIQKFAVTQGVVAIVVQQAGQLKLLRYDLELRTSDPARVLEVIELPLKGQDAASASCFLLVNQNFAVISLYTGLNLLITSRRQQKSQVFQLTNDKFPRAVITAGVISPGNDIILGTEAGFIYYCKLKPGERKWSFDGDGVKLVHTMPEAVTGIDFEAYIIDEKLEKTAFELGASPCSIDLNSENLPVDYIPANNMNCKDPTMRRWIITLSTANGFRLLEGRGVTPGDVLLASNARDLLTASNGKIAVNEDKKPLNYEYTSQVPEASALQNTNCAFLRRDALTRQPTGWIWFFMEPHTGQVKMCNDVVYSDDAEIERFVAEGWTCDEPVAITAAEVKELFSYSRQEQELAVCVMVGQLPPDAEKLHDAEFGFLSSQETPITAQQFLQEESGYFSMLYDIATQTETIIDAAAIRESAPLSVTCSNYQCCVSYADELVCISLITKQLSYRISSEDLVANLLKCTDPALNFNSHPETMLSQTTFVQFQRSERRIYVASAAAVFELRFNDEKDLCGEMIFKKQFEEALECSETQRQREEVKYYWALHEIRARKYLEAAQLLAQTPRNFEDALAQFISEDALPGFSECAYGSKNQYFYVNREAVIAYCEAKLKVFATEEVSQKAHEAEKMWMNRASYADGQQKELQNSILLEKQITAVAVFTILEYLIYVNELYFETFGNTGEGQFVSFEIVPLRSKKRQTKQEFLEDCYKQNQELKFMKTRIPELNKRLSRFIESYNSFLPVDMCRELLGYSANTSAYETFLKSIEDVRGLFTFYFSEFSKFASSPAPQNQKKSSYEGSIIDLRGEFALEQSAETVLQSLMSVAAEYSQNERHSEEYYEYARRIFIASPTDAQRILVDFCAVRDEIDPLRFLSTFLLAIDSQRPEGLRESVAEFLLEAQQVCGWSQPWLWDLVVRCLCGLRTERSEQRLRALMSLHPREQRFGYERALRALHQADRCEALLDLYISRGDFAAAVKEALAHGLFERARAAALLSGDPAPLLTEIALARAPELGAFAALQFVNGGQRRVRVESLLRGGARIDSQLKQEIKASMADYQEEVETLRAQIETSNSSTEQIARDLDRLRRRFVYVRAAQECSKCRAQLTKARFIAFGCGHAMHYECAVEMAASDAGGAGMARRERIRQLTAELKAKSDERDRASVENELDDIILKECPFCQIFAISQLPESAEWEIKL